MNIYFKMCDGYIFNVFFKEIVGKKETTGLRLKGRGLRLTGYHSTSKLEKTEKKKKKKRNSYCLWVHTYTHTLLPSLYLGPILCLSPLPAPPLTCLVVKPSVSFSGKNQRPRTLNYSRAVTYRCHPVSTLEWATLMKLEAATGNGDPQGSDSKDIDQVGEAPGGSTPELSVRRYFERKLQ